MNKKHVPSLELCQEFDRLCKEKGIVVPETEFYWVVDTEAKINRLVAKDEPIVEYEQDQEMGSIFPTPLDILNDPYWSDWKDSEYITVVPAPLVSEQGEILHKTFVKMKEERIVIFNPRGSWSRIVKAVNIMENEANARQKCINYLMAEGIITKL